MKILQLIPMPGSEAPYRLPSNESPKTSQIILGLALIEDENGSTEIEYLTMEVPTGTLYITRGYFGGTDFNARRN